MLSEFLQDRAALYATGAMTAPDREDFELILEFHHELRSLVAGFQEVVSAVMLSHVTPSPSPPPGLKTRILDALESRRGAPEPVGLVVTSADGRVEWVNGAFTQMCGYSLEELRGRKPGSLLQGAETDRDAVQRIRDSVRAGRPCSETLVNYHKSGARYRVNLAISPFLDDEQRPLWFVARERELRDFAPVGSG